MATIYTYTVQYQGVQYLTSRSTSVHKSAQVFNSLCTGLVLNTVGNYYIIQIFYQVAMFVYFILKWIIAGKSGHKTDDRAFLHMRYLLFYPVYLLGKKPTTLLLPSMR